MNPHNPFNPDGDPWEFPLPPVVVGGVTIPDAVPLGEAPLRVLAAVDFLLHRDGRATHDSIAEACGLSSKSTVHSHLTWLRRIGLIDWDENRPGSIRLAVERVDVERPQRPKVEWRKVRRLNGSGFGWVPEVVSPN